MSGFFGMLRQDGESVDQELLEQIAEGLRFRGPDGVEIWREKEAGGCFALMRTGPRKPAEPQPLQIDTRFRCWADLRLDGREELRRELGEEGRRLDSESSSEEYFLQAWRKWGPAALEKIVGDFSLALWDTQRETLWCARDFVGARPFYYANTGQVFCYSNTLDILRRIPGVSSELDEAFVGDFLLEGWNTEPSRTVYRDIRRLPAGHVLKFSSGQIEVRRFQKLPVEEPLRMKTAEEYVQAYLELLKMAVGDRLPEGAAALYLSGGLDSGSVCAIASQIASEHSRKDMLKAFTVSWEPYLADREPAIATLTARHLGLAQEILREEKSTPFELSDGGDGRTPEPTMEPFFAREQRQCRGIAAHARVVLSGDGGDNVLTGQGWPYLVHLWERGEWKEIVSDFGAFVLSHGRVPPPRRGFRRKISQLFRGEDSADEYPPWLSDDFESRANLKQRWHELRNSTRQDEHPVHPRAYAGLHSGYWAGVLETEDTGWTRVHLETRAPLLDLRLLKFLLRLPPVPWCVDKELVRRAMKGLLPAEVVRRPKTPLARDASESLTADEWTSGVSLTAPERLKGFVKWEKWCETFCGSKGSLSWLNLRPLGLLRWLIAIENAKGIK